MQLWEQARSTQAGGPWLTYSDPAQAGWSADKLKNAKQLFDEIGSSALLVIDRGAVAVAWGNVTTPYRCHSVRKSILSALYGIHIQQGSIDINQTLAELGVDDKPPLTEQERQAKVVHLLKARSGIYHEAASETVAMKKKRPVRGSHVPDTHWYYNNWDFNALETILELATGSTVFDEFEKQLAKPLRMEDFIPALHTQVNKQEHISVHGARHYRLSARDLARFGLLYLQNGSFDHQQLIPESWIQESTAPHSVMEELSRGYGYLWWRPLTGNWPELGMYEARGVGGQHVTIIPKENLVLVHRVDTDSGRTVPGDQVLRLCQLIIEARTGAIVQAPPELIPLDVESEEINHLLSHYQSFHHSAKALTRISEEYWQHPLSATSLSPLDLLARMVNRDAKVLQTLLADAHQETAAVGGQASQPQALSSPTELIGRFVEQREQLYSILQSLSPVDWKRTYSWKGREISVKAYFLTGIQLDYEQAQPLIRFFNKQKELGTLNE
ncbi:serine hydrolase domain-containing protein [Paenibacillus sp. UNC451MF]|uniref:serine hydrolase domain-containing protein n=1 Tax=Paenibacillus sp. UNC451MF TaxID=1449063 RepID=UPI0006916B8E|nr:serine hydrolase [Paenibacillus sp. UNC451MF]